MTFLENIARDIDWRVSELATLTTLPYRYHIADIHIQTLLTYSIPAIYALWEGFVRNSFAEYVQQLNSLNLNINAVNENLLTHALTNGKEINLENARTNFDSKKKYIKVVSAKYLNPLNIIEELPTHSNVNYNVINDILMRFNLESLEQKYKAPLQKLLIFRNSIAHGERTIPVKKKDIEFFSNLLKDLMLEIYVKIENGYNGSTYLKT